MVLVVAMSLQRKRTNVTICIPLKSFSAITNFNLLVSLRLTIVVAVTKHYRFNNNLNNTLLNWLCRTFRHTHLARYNHFGFWFFFVCLFLWGLSSYSRIFHSYGDVTITGEGLQILTYAWHSWPLGSKGSLVCHTYCDTGHPFIMVISERLAVELSLPVFTA